MKARRSLIFSITSLTVAAGLIATSFALTKDSTVQNSASEVISQVVAEDDTFTYSNEEEISTLSTDSVIAEPINQVLPGSSSPQVYTQVVNAAPGPAGAFNFTGPVTINGNYDSMPYQLPLNPAGPQATMIRWVYGWGVGPTNPTDGTMYLLGHAWARQKLVFNPISELATNTTNLQAPVAVPAVGGGTVPRYYTNALNGSRITLTDPQGNNRTWVINSTYLIHKHDAIKDAELVNTGIRNRVVIITCAVQGNTDLDYNVILSGYLA